jgi:uncharacterized membrane protein
MLVVVFDTENKAYEGEKALLQLDHEGSLTVYTHAVLAKKADGTTVVLRSDDSGPIGTLLGTTWGALIGLLGGPVGVAVGAGAGLVAGGALDLGALRLGSDFIEDATKLLQPNRVAVVAEIDENWTTPVDARMEEFGGTVVRRSLSEVQEKIDNEHVAAMKADLAQMKAEHAKAHADRKAKIHDKINQLEAKLAAQLQKSKEKREAVEREEMAKVEALQAKAAAAKGKAE